jgi:nudix-type nucleoside diphosphatase (YffH/AdpP family)
MTKSRRAEIHRINRKFDGFFKVDEIDASHEAVDGTMRREQRLVFERGDSVAVLLYDATSKEVIVLEQFRAPVLVARRRDDRHSSDGWIVEAVAGMIDEGETPEQAVIREAQEETGYRIAAPRPIGMFFSSPGGTSERTFLYFAEVVAADRTGEGGGIAGEEDIALVRLSTDELFHRLKSHQIQDPKLVIAAYWLKDHLARTASSSRLRNQDTGRPQ